MQQLAANRAQREKEEEERKAKVKAEWLAREKLKKEALEKELAVIEAKRKLEKEERDAKENAGLGQSFLDSWPFTFMHLKPFPRYRPILV